jgi:hypothetical protein
MDITAMDGPILNKRSSRWKKILFDNVCVSAREWKLAVSAVLSEADGLVKEGGKVRGFYGMGKRRWQ